MGAGEHGNDAAFRVLCETSGVGFWHIDTTGRTRYANLAMCAILEVDAPGELADHTYHRFFTEESLRRMAVEHARRPGGVASTYEAELLGMRGGRRSVVISGVPVTGATGELTGVFGTFTDITERKRAELAVRNSEEMLHSLFAASVDAIGVARLGRHVMVNPAYLRMFDYAEASDLIDRPILDLIAPGERERIAHHVWLRAEGTNDVDHYVTRGLRRDGREFALEVHVARYDVAGESHSVAIFRDLTERLQLEEQLRQSQKMDALGRLAGGVAHDFNNLLTVILSCADLALTALPEEDKAAANVRLIRATGERAAALTRQLLALSRRQVIDPKIIDLNVVVEEMVAILRRLIGSQVVLTLDSDRALAPVRVDASQLQQVLMNLCVNARDAMPEGGKVTIRTRNVYLDARTKGLGLDFVAGEYVALEVVDTGHGMSAETQQRLFEPFFTTKGPGRGTGLGLSTAYGIVKQSGGHISATSSVGAGSAFRVYLPAAEGPSRAAAPAFERSSGGSTGTLLLVEDEPALRELVREFLTTSGYRVLAAADGLEALALIAAEPGAVDLVVTDVLMPGMPGVELATALDRVAPGTRILFISGYAREHASVLASRPGAAFLAKPFTLPQLTAQVRALMATSSVPPQR
jgi:two-component system cell cycle sensor histidine kinase/response regulator CckA